MRLTVMGLGFIVATAMLSHGWREFAASTQNNGDVHAAAAVLILAGAIMGFGSLMTIWNPPGTFILHGLAGLLAIISGAKELPAAYAYGAVALLLCGMAILDSIRSNQVPRRS